MGVFYELVDPNNLEKLVTRVDPARARAVKEGMRLFVDRQRVPEPPGPANQVIEFELGFGNDTVCARNTRRDHTSLKPKVLSHADTVHSRSGINKKPAAPSAPTLGQPARGEHRDAARPGHLTKRTAHDTCRPDQARGDTPKRVAPCSTFRTLPPCRSTLGKQPSSKPAPFEHLQTPNI